MQQEYIVARTVTEAVHLLNEKNGRVIAGGTDLMLDLRKGKKHSEVLIDITEISELAEVTAEGNRIRVGACCTFSQLEKDPVVMRYLPALAAGASRVGSPQIRNIATVGGNVVNAMPAADTAVALVGLGAQVEVAGICGCRTLPIEACYKRIGQSTVNPEKEVVTAFYIPIARDGTFYNGYRRFSLRESLSLPVVVTAVSGLLHGRSAENVRVVLAPAGAAPWHAEAAEKLLNGQIITPDLAERAAKLAAEAAPFRDSPVRCSAAYKRLVAQTMVEELLLEMAEGSEEM